MDIKEKHLNDSLLTLGHVIIRTYKSFFILPNLVTYKGRDFLRERIRGNSVHNTHYVHLLGLGGWEEPFPAPVPTVTAPTRNDDQLEYDLGTYIEPTTVTKDEPSARGRVRLEFDYLASTLTRKFLITELGLFLADVSDPTIPIQDAGKNYLFSRVIFPEPVFLLAPYEKIYGISLYVDWRLMF